MLRQCLPLRCLVDGHRLASMRLCVGVCILTHVVWSLVLRYSLAEVLGELTRLTHLVLLGSCDGLDMGEAVGECSTCLEQWNGRSGMGLLVEQGSRLRCNLDFGQLQTLLNTLLFGQCAVREWHGV